VNFNSHFHLVDISIAPVLPDNRTELQQIHFDLLNAQLQGDKNGVKRLKNEKKAAEKKAKEEKAAVKRLEIEEQIKSLSTIDRTEEEEFQLNILTLELKGDKDEVKRLKIEKKLKAIPLNNRTEKQQLEFDLLTAQLVGNKNEVKRLKSEKKKIIDTWFKANIGNPYPTKDQKQKLMKESGLKQKQVEDHLYGQRKKNGLSKAKPNNDQYLHLFQLKSLSDWNARHQPVSQVTAGNARSLNMKRVETSSSALKKCGKCGKPKKKHSYKAAEWDKREDDQRKCQVCSRDVRPSLEQKLATVEVIKPTNETKLGLTLQHFQVARISPKSLFHDTELEVGMIIRSVNGKTYSSYNEGVNLFNTIQPGKVIIKASYPGAQALELPLAIRRCEWNDNEKRLFQRGKEMYDKGLLKPLRLGGDKWYQQIASFMRTRDYAQVIAYHNAQIRSSYRMGA